MAFRWRDNRPQEVVARQIRRGAAGAGEDSVAFEIGPFNTRSPGTSSVVVDPLDTENEAIAGGRAALCWSSHTPAAACGASAAGRA